MRRAEERPAPSAASPVAVPPVPSRHGPIAQLLIAWSPLSAIVLAYAVAAWVNAPLAAGISSTNRWGFGLHVAGPAAADHAVFGVNPSAWLQERLVQDTTHWYDAAAALVYVTHVVAIPLATALVWFRLRRRFSGWLVAVLTFVLVGMGGYVLYPAAPPWMAAQDGRIAPVDRISTLGWERLHLDFVGHLTRAAQDGSNPVAAMPSLHAGSALLVALFLWPAAGAAWRAVLAAYVVAMALTLVYTGEHYVVDVVAGWLTAAVAAATSAAYLRRRRGGGEPSTTPPG